MTLAIEISPGELIDRITILEIKLERILDPLKLASVRRNHAQLTRVLARGVSLDDRLSAWRSDLKAVNETIWHTEDAIRDHERRQDFGDSFVALARAVYINNDRRAALKRQIDDHLASPLAEEKSYSPY